MTAKQKIIFTVIWGACGKCGVSLGENPKQEAVEKFIRKHKDCCESTHYPRLVGHLVLPSVLKGKRVSVVLVPEPLLCRYKECMNYKKGTEDFCSPRCKALHKEAILERKRLEAEAEKKAKAAKATVECKRKKCRNYSRKAKGYCCKKCRRKDRRKSVTREE